MPNISRLRLLRHWGGVVDMTPDAAPIISKTPVDGLYLNGGWCYGGFKATPASGWCFAQLLADDEVPALARPFALDRFRTGAPARRSRRRPLCLAPVGPRDARHHLPQLRRTQFRRVPLRRRRLGDPPRP